MTVTYGSVCSGIEAATVAWESLGWKPEWFSQFDPLHNYSKQADFPSRVLAHHYPNIPNWGDMTQLANLVRCGVIAAPDVLVGGTPCQAFSISGLRKGLKDPRGQLTIAFGELADAIDEKREKPCKILWENVPGVLNSKDNAFGCFLALLAGESCELKPPGRKWSNAGCVSGPKRVVAWRVLDAQYFGLAQRRKRVFVIASADPRFDPTSLLFECESVRRDTPPSREQKKNLTGGIERGVTQGVTELATFGGGNTKGHIDVATTCTAHGYRQDFDTETFVVQYSFPINTQMALRGAETSNSPREGIGIGDYDSPSFTLLASHHHAVAYGKWISNENSLIFNTYVRRLMPIECERLQGFPDNYTNIPGATDANRYKALGNSMAVPVMRWLGERLK